MAYPLSYLDEEMYYSRRPEAANSLYSPGQDRYANVQAAALQEIAPAAAAPAVTQGASPAAAAASASSSVPSLVLGGIGTAANIWSGYQQDKLAQQKAAEEKRRYYYERGRRDRAEDRATRQVSGQEITADRNNAMDAVDWFAEKYVRRS